MATALASSGTTIKEAFLDYFTEHEQEVKDANIMQMRRGLMPDGEPIMPGYLWGDSYYAYRKRYKAKYNRFDLMERPYLTPNLGLTGAFYNGIIVVKEDNAVYFTSIDHKWESAIDGYHGEPHAPLHERYGNVLGLSREYIADIVVPKMKQDIIVKLRTSLGI